MRILFFLVFTSALVACGGGKDDSGTTSADTTKALIEAVEVNTEPSASYDEARVAAVAAIQTAAEKGHAWSTSDQLVEEAAAAAAAGDEALAISLADEARIHATLAALQADREAIAWRDNIITE